jgi:oligo-1,6-glucosidase
MTNGAFNSLDEIMDIESHNVDKMAKSLGIFQPFRWNLIKKTSRDNARTPRQWTAEEGAGFTSGTPWLKINPNYKEINVEADLADPDGVIAFFRKIAAIKKSSEVLKNGSFRPVLESKHVYAFERELDGECLLAVASFKDGEVRAELDMSGETIVSNYENATDVLRPYEFRLIRRTRR